MQSKLAKTCPTLLATLVCVAATLGGKHESTRYELLDGLYLDIPGSSDSNDTYAGDGRSLLTLALDPSTARKRAGKDDGQGGLERLLPLFILPFLVQSAIVPVFLSGLKFLLIKSLLIGKLALVLIAANAFRNSNTFKSRNEERLADIHYGYHGNGMEEYGSFINARSSTKS